MTREFRPDLGPSRARWVRRKYAKGWSIATIARAFGVPHYVIYTCVTKRTYCSAERRKEKASAARKTKTVAVASPPKQKATPELGEWSERGDGERPTA
jgi:hypothetical protein